jgi:hypothetical protein
VHECPTKGSEPDCQIGDNLLNDPWMLNIKPLSKGASWRGFTAPEDIINQ